MANNEDLPPFDDKYQTQIKNTLNTTVDSIQEKMSKVQSSSVEDAERMLDEACDDCVKTFQTKLDEIKASVKKAKPDSSSQTYDEDSKKYQVYVEATARGIEKTKSLFDTVIERIRSIVSTVLECIKAGVEWIWSQLSEVFAAVRRDIWNF